MAYVTLHFDANVMAHLHVNWLSPVKVRRTLVGGSRKMVSYDDLEPSEKIRVYDKGITLKDASAPANGDGNGKHAMLVGYRSGDVWAPQIALTEALSIEARHFVDCIAEQPDADRRWALRPPRRPHARSRHRIDARIGPSH